MNRAGPLLTLVAVGAVGCATASANRALSQGTDDHGLSVDKVPTKGFDADFKMVSLEAMDVTGELFAVDAEHLWVKTPTGLQGLHRAEVAKVTLDVLGDHLGLPLGIMTTLGALSTGSHGFFLLASLPIWLLTGIPIAVGSAQASDVELVAPNFAPLYQFARFPQGLPPGLAECPKHPASFPVNDGPPL